MEQANGQIPCTHNLPALSHPILPPFDLNNPKLWNDNPSPTLSPNIGLSADQFTSRERAIGILPKDASLISVDLVPFSAAQDKNIFFHDVSPERMVWGVKVAYLNGIWTRRAFYSNATQTSIYDTQTGKAISSTTTGDRDASSLRTPWSHRKRTALNPDQRLSGTPKTTDYALKA
jgi:hypothetical protein